MSNSIETTLSQSMTSVLRDMQESMSGEVDAIRNQTAQIESLLKDAIASLHESFGSIHEASEQQMKAMTAMMMEVVGANDDKNIFQKTENASEILTGLIETRLLSSKNNLRTLTAMDKICKQLQVMISIGQEKDALITQLCACSESEQVDVALLRSLSGQLRDKENEQSEFSSRLMAKFKKTHQLIDCIGSKDMDEVFEGKEKVESILNHFFQINTIVTSNRIKINQVNTEIRQHLGSAIRALQFEDISTQSLRHTDRHLGRMAGMIAILTDGLEGLEKSDTTDETYVDRIAAIHSAMDTYHQTLRLEGNNPVSQDSMNEGDIDLF